VLSVALMVVDRFDLLKPVRSQMSLVLMESYWITDLPQRCGRVRQPVGSRTELVAENEKLKTETCCCRAHAKLAASPSRTCGCASCSIPRTGQRRSKWPS
jgi:rod shape-determining protein MreC